MYTYSIIFSEPNQKQQDRIISIFDDYSWSAGLDVEEEVTNELIDKNYVLKFKSNKHFNNTDEDYEKNIFHCLIGKGQFFSSLFFDDLGFEDLKVEFIDNEENSWKVDISKYSDLKK
mgnify:CR=1 FL=1|tara:strand:- start:96 stop:446 length:351 start_codon:yes stop_codon:yes gene_type:complete